MAIQEPQGARRLLDRFPGTKSPGVAMTTLFGALTVFGTTVAADAVMTNRLAV